MAKPKITERGWGGHFICADRCKFRRNTLIDFGGRKKLVVSTVGLMTDYHKEGEYDTIGAGGRYYETLAFWAQKDGAYWDANVSRQISFKSPWAICSEIGWKHLPKDVDNRANAMHERVVRELARKQPASARN